MKRLGIFLFYSPNGKVYEYVKYLLSSMRNSLDKLVVVCNGFVSLEGKATLRALSDEFVVRANEGFDFGAWREAILDVCGLEEVRSYDELVLFNDSFFGPFYPFSEIFQRMEDQDTIDFWGFSSHGAVAKKSGDNRPPYLQTYFLVLRKPVLVSNGFETYWKTLQSCETFDEHVENVACKFTDYFANLGFAWTAYTPTFDLEDPKHVLNMSHHMYNSYEMVAYRGFPVIKRKTFLMSRFNFLKYSNAEELGKTLQYIDKNTAYDTSLIWEYLLDNCTLESLNTTLGLTHVLSSHVELNAPCCSKSVAFIAHLFYEDLFEESIEYLCNVPPYADVVITTNNVQKQQQLMQMVRNRGLSNAEVRVVGNRGRDVAALLIGCKDVVLSHDYIGYVHDKKSAHNQYYQAGVEFAQLLMKCILNSSEYVEQIVSLFDDNANLGLLVPPKPWHATHFNKIANTYWTVAYDQTCSVLSRLGIRVPISRGVDCMAVGTAFWMRSDAVRPLFEEDWQLEDFMDEPLPTDGTLSHGIERCFPYVAQSQGFYTAVVMPDEIAEQAVIDYAWMRETTIDALEANRDIAVGRCRDYPSYIKALNSRVAQNLITKRRATLKRFYKRITKKVPLVIEIKKHLKKRFGYAWNRI